MTEHHPGPEHASPPRSAAETPPRRARASFTAALALLLAALSAAGVAFLWRQHRAVDAALNDAQLEIEESLERARAAQRALSGRVDALRDTVEASRARDARATSDLDALPGRLDELGRRVDEIPARLDAFERRLAEAQVGSPDAGSLDAKAAWLRAEAEYYLTVANAELGLAGRWDGAETALELADERLRELGDPALRPVRRQIAADLLALRSVERPDVERIVFDLAGLEARADELPLRSPGAAREDAAAPEGDETGLARLAGSAKRALGRLITIERREDSTARTLSAERRAAARHSLATELASARGAVLQGRQAVYSTSLASAAELLARDFDAADPGVRAAAALVAGLAASDIAPPRPDIGRSLVLLRGAGSGAGGAEAR